MVLQHLWESLEATPIGQYVASSSWAFPTIETVHVIAIVSVMGTIAVMDLRLLGLASKDCAVTEIEKDTLKWTWGAFILAFMSGSLLFVAKATSYAVNPYFFWKMIVIAAAGINMMIFHASTWKSVKEWDQNSPVPRGGRIAGWLSLGLWVLVAFLGRAIGFTLDKYTT